MLNHVYIYNPDSRLGYIYVVNTVDGVGLFGNGVRLFEDIPNNVLSLQTNCLGRYELTFSKDGNSELLAVEGMLGGKVFISRYRDSCEKMKEAFETGQKVYISVAAKKSIVALELEWTRKIYGLFLKCSGDVAEVSYYFAKGFISSAEVHFGHRKKGVTEKG